MVAVERGGLLVFRTRCDIRSAILWVDPDQKARQLENKEGRLIRNIRWACASCGWSDIKYRTVVTTTSTRRRRVAPAGDDANPYFVRGRGGESQGQGIICNAVAA